MPAAKPVVSMLEVAALGVASLPPVAVQAYVKVCLGLKFVPLLDTVTGSPAKTGVVGLASKLPTAARCSSCPG